MTQNSIILGVIIVRAMLDLVSGTPFYDTHSKEKSGLVTWDLGGILWYHGCMLQLHWNFCLNLKFRLYNNAVEKYSQQCSPPPGSWRGIWLSSERNPSHMVGNLTIWPLVCSNSHPIACQVQGIDHLPKWWGTWIFACLLPLQGKGDSGLTINRCTKASYSRTKWSRLQSAVQTKWLTTCKILSDRPATRSATTSS